MSSTTELARREERAQGGIIQFAEEMQAIREQNLYPGAKLRLGEPGYEPEPWATYCKERWGMGKAMVDKIILARPVIERRARSAATRSTVEAAATVATLPEAVQDAILDTTETRDDTRAKAKAVRKAAKRIEQNEGREATVDELIEAAQNVKPPKKPKRKMKDSRFITLASPALHFIEEAADYAQGNVLSDTENDWAWVLVEKFRYHTDRIADKLSQPEHVKDIDEAFAHLVEEMER